MINGQILVLAATAVTIGFVHTVLGPDHYLPFIVISRARMWSLPKTLLISFFCGLGHVLSSVVLGFLGIALGIAVSHIKAVESFRGGAAAWLLIGFGFTYFIWGLHRALKNKSHKHLHFHAEGQEHDHLHSHETEHSHVHSQPKRGVNLTPWILFVIFVFGPCEPLIPLVMYPGLKHSISGVIVVTLAFGLTTILTMLAIIYVSSWGISFFRFGRMERYIHAIAGVMIFISGVSVQFLGL